MKEIKIILEESEYNKLVEVKGVCGFTWKDLVMYHLVKSPDKQIKLKKESLINGGIKCQLKKQHSITL